MILTVALLTLMTFLIFSMILTQIVRWWLSSLPLLLSGGGSAAVNCDKCKTHPASLSAVVDGVYYRNLCHSCKPLPKVSSGHARWERDLDVQDNEADIQQPYNADGTINVRFAKLYPQQAAVLFTPEQIRDAELK